MNAGALPPMLVCASLALALTIAPRRVACLITFFVASIAVASMPVPPHLRNAIFFGCWSSVIASVASVHLPRVTIGLAVSLWAGVCAGAVTTVAGSRLDLLSGFFVLTLLLPLALFAHRRVPAAIHVLASWLVAVAVITAALQILLETPGYLADHLE